MPSLKGQFVWVLCLCISTVCACVAAACFVSPVSSCHCCSLLCSPMIHCLKSRSSLVFVGSFWLFSVASFLLPVFIFFFCPTLPAFFFCFLFSLFFCLWFWFIYTVYIHWDLFVLKKIKLFFFERFFSLLLLTLTNFTIPPFNPKWYLICWWLYFDSGPELNLQPLKEAILKFSGCQQISRVSQMLRSACSRATPVLCLHWNFID